MLDFLTSVKFVLVPSSTYDIIMFFWSYPINVSLPGTPSRYSLGSDTFPKIIFTWLPVFEKCSSPPLLNASFVPIPTLKDLKSYFSLYEPVWS